MRKVLFTVVMAAVCLTFANCEKTKKQEKAEALVVENTVSTDREAMP